MKKLLKYVYSDDRDNYDYSDEFDTVEEAIADARCEEFTGYIFIGTLHLPDITFPRIDIYKDYMSELSYVDGYETLWGHHEAWVKNIFNDPNLTKIIEEKFKEIKKEILKTYPIKFWEIKDIVSFDLDDEEAECEDC